MNDREMEQLMNAQLDGVATAEESERLQRALESSEALRIEYRKLGGVFTALSGVEMEDPPAGLKPTVLRATRQRSEAMEERQGWVETVVGLFRLKPTLRYAYSFSAGAALGILAFALLNGELLSKAGVDRGQVSGTIGIPTEGSYQRIDKEDFVLGEGRLLAETLSGKEGLVARVTATAPPGSDFVLSFDPSVWSAVTLRQRPAGNEVMLGSGRLSVRIQESGQSQYLLYLARRGPAGSPLRIAIHSPDGFVHGELGTRALRSGS